MKKQLFILTILLLAVTGVFAQNPPHDQPPLCTGTAAEPAIGVEYTYTVSVPSNAGYDGDGFYHWYIFGASTPAVPIDLINDTPLAEGTGFDVTVLTTYNNAANTTMPISITWQSSALGVGTYYLVINYTEENAQLAACNPNNIKVYEIKPQNTFWLKIANAADAAGTAGGAIICSPTVANATLNTAGTIEYDFGMSTHFIKINANGYTGTFVPRLELTTLPNDMTYGNVTWTSASGATGIFTGTATGGIWTSDNDMPSLNTYDPTAVPPTWGDGEVIIVSIEINHNHKEAITDIPLQFAIDGTYEVNSVTYYDKYPADATNTCANDVGFGDLATRSLLARPQVDPNTPPTFVGGNNIP